jgi:hypothetical protein
MYFGSFRRLTFALATLALLGTAFINARAQTAGPFDGLAGSWSGEGSIKLSSGGTERLRCQANYTVSGGGDTLQQDLRCKSDSYSFDLLINLTNQAGAIVGNWSETARGIQGGIAGQGSKGKIQATVRGQAFTATISLTTRGSQQAVSIRAQGQELSEVSITLHRGH